MRGGFDHRKSCQTPPASSIKDCAAFYPASDCSPVAMKLKLKSVPPGVPFLFRILLVLAAPPASVYLVARTLTSQGILTELPTWAWVVAGVLSGPLFYAVRIWLKYRSHRLGAARHGAILPPDLSGTWIGNWDILDGILDAFTNGYPCECPVKCVRDERTGEFDGYGCVR